MKTKLTIFGIPITQLISLSTLVAGVLSIWIHLEVRIAEINVDINNLKKELNEHKIENRTDFENLRHDLKADTREIIQKVDEIQIYLRKK